MNELLYLCKEGDSLAWLSEWLSELEKEGKLEQIEILKISLSHKETSQAFSKITKLTNLKKLHVVIHPNDPNNKQIFIDPLLNFACLKELEFSKLQTFAHHPLSPFFQTELYEVSLKNSLNQIRVKLPFLEDLRSSKFCLYQGSWDMQYPLINDQFPQKIRLLKLNFSDQTTPEEYKKILKNLEGVQLEDLEKLYFNGLSEDLIKILSKATNLKFLSFDLSPEDKNLNKDKLFQSINQIKGLETICFSHLTFDNNILYYLRNLYNLLNLHINASQNFNKNVATTNIPSLKNLYIDGKRVSLIDAMQS